MNIDKINVRGSAKEELTSIAREIEEENSVRRRAILKERLKELNAAERVIKKLRKGIEDLLKKDVNEFSDELY